MQNKLQCQDCKRVQYSTNTSGTLILQIPAIKDGLDESGKVKYKDVKLLDILDQYFSPDSRNFTCPHDMKPTEAIQYYY